MKIRPLRRALLGARRLHEDEGGAALVFAVITLFSLALAMFMVFQIGLVTTDRLQIQTAADAAAYSGAQVEANAVNSIGQLNDGMAFVHYSTLRYVLDQIVYGTLHAFETHPQWVGQRQPDLAVYQQPLGATFGGLPSEFGQMIEGGPRGRPTPAWVMLGDEDEWNGNRGRWTRTRDRGKRAIEEGKKWLLELNAASHLILKETPRLVREKAAEVAFLNGASHVAVSSDLTNAFWKDGKIGDGFVDAVGLSDSSQVAGSLPHRYMARRIKVDQANPISEYPTWFSPERGTYDGDGYSSIRICWNPNDWAHRTGGGAHPGFSWSEPPNGHWHARHNHFYFIDPEMYLISPPTPHGGLTGNVQEAPCGSGVGGGHEADDYQLHLQVEESRALGLALDQTGDIAHHAVVRCPTCQSNDGAGAGKQWTQLRKKTEEHAKRDPSLTLALTFESDDFPRPLLIAGPLLRSGVTVATWRESHGIGDVLPRSDWGMIAVASAQIGLLDAEGRVHALQKLDSTTATYGSGVGGGDEGMIPLDRQNDTKHRNLHYSHDNANHPGMRFGARLVPIRNALTHHPTLEQGEAVEELLKDGSRWFTTSDPRNPAPSNITAEGPPGLPMLRQWFAVNSFQELKEVFWH